jgi:hypothetical protein
MQQEAEPFICSSRDSIRQTMSALGQFLTCERKAKIGQNRQEPPLVMTRKSVVLGVSERNGRARVSMNNRRKPLVAFGANASSCQRPRLHEGRRRPARPDTHG